MYCILRNLKTFEQNMYFLVLITVWHFLLLLSSRSSLHYLCPDKSDKCVDSQGFCAAGGVAINGEGLGIFALVEIYLR